MNCNTCGDRMVSLVADLRLCKNCGLVSSAIEADLTLYDKSYLRKYQRYETTDIGVAINALRADMISDHHKYGDSILDFGCVGS